jgi:uncharacterized protein
MPKIMKKFYLTMTIAVFLLICSGRIQAQTKQTQPAAVSFGTRDVINSKILNEQRRILVYIPNSAFAQIYSKQRYPVIYLLDGDAYHFASVVGKVQYLSSGYVCPEMIVVGIPNTDRTRDLTPTHMDSWNFLNMVFNTDLSKSSGGGEKFISFIEKELIPHIDSLYPTTTYRMLIGHSFGGLTVMNTLIHHTELFKAYVAIDPAMSWDNQKLLTETKDALANKNFNGASLFLGIASIGMDTVKVKTDKTIGTENMRSLFELRNYINDNKQNQLKFSCIYYPNDNHITIPFLAEYDALRFIFYDFYFNVLGDDYKNIQHQYENISKQLGYKIKPPESMVNSIAYNYLSFRMFDAAIFLFKLNVINYPDSYNVYDSLGEYYEATGDKLNAIDYYKKALSIKEVPAIRQKLEKLQQK